MTASSSPSTNTQIPLPRDVPPLLARIVPISSQTFRSFRNTRFFARSKVRCRGGLDPFSERSPSSTLVYASNRNTGANDDPRRDPIAVFTLDAADREFQIIDRLFAFTRLKQVRGMQFGGPDNGFLVASGLVVDGGVMVFEGVVHRFILSEIS